MLTLREESNCLDCWIQIKWQMIDSLSWNENLLHFSVIARFSPTVKTKFFCFDHPIFKKLTQRTEMFETTHWYFHISIVSLHKKEKKTTTQLLWPMVATTVHLIENVFMI